MHADFDVGAFPVATGVSHAISSLVMRLLGDSPSLSSPDTSVQDSIDRMNQQMATDAANAAA
jgi:hypothetical protein